MSDISQFHQEAIQLREQGESAAALAKYELAQIEYLQQNNPNYLINLWLEKAIVYKHLYLAHHHSPWYAVLTDQAVATANALAAQLQPTVEQLSLIKFWQGESALMQGEYEKAVTAFNSSLEILPPDHHQIGNQRAHLAIALAAAGQPDDALYNLNLAIQEIMAQTQTDDYTKQVWLSGAYLKQAAIYASLSDVKQAETAWQQAASIVTANPDLILRKQHLEQLRLQLGTGSFSWADVL